MDLLHQLAYSFGHTGELTYVISFLAAIAESLAFVGTVVPGTTIIVLAGFAASRGVIDPIHLVWFVIAGALIGDFFSYYLGTKGVRFFKDENRLLKASYLRRGEAFFKRHGSKSVFLGRFVPPIRAIIPFVAGASSMDTKLFLFWNTASAVVWASLVVTVGYFFGSAYHTIEHWISRSSAVLFGLAVLAVLFWYSFQSARPYLKALVRSAWRNNDKE